MAITIPADLHAFLAKPGKRRLKLTGCMTGPVTLCAPNELTAKMFTIYKRDGFNKDRFRGVDLVSACQDEDPSGIMVWFSALKVYGQWDCDHHKIIVFPGVTWSDIARNPVPYFEAQWEPDNVPHRYLKPRTPKPATKTNKKRAR
jgi:hypothetical protein